MIFACIPSDLYPASISSVASFVKWGIPFISANFSLKFSTEEQIEKYKERARRTEYDHWKDWIIFRLFCCEGTSFYNKYKRVNRGFRQIKITPG